MKNILVGLGLSCSVGFLSLMLIARAGAQTIFTDNFRSGASPLWGNEVGNWSAAGGEYRVSAPANSPAAFSSLPLTLTDFSVDFDISGVEDGGIYLRSTPVPGSEIGIQGVLLNLKIPDRGPKIYWHIMTNGTDASIPLNVSYIPYGRNPHVHIEVSGNSYAAFVNGSPTPATTLTTSLFPSGRVALYSFSSQGFHDFILQAGSGQSAQRRFDPRNVALPVLEKFSPASRPLSMDSMRLENLAQSIVSERPLLDLKTGLVISWPATSSDYVLEQNSDLNTTNWTVVTNPVRVVNQVILPPPSGNRFFRLSAP